MVLVHGIGVRFLSREPFQIGVTAAHEVLALGVWVRILDLKLNKENNASREL